VNHGLRADDVHPGPPGVPTEDATSIRVSVTRFLGGWSLVDQHIGNLLDRVAKRVQAA
jgi:hypothetical protein